MQVADLCNRSVVYVLARDTVADAARLMRERHVGSVVVVENEAGRKPVGMFTDRDVTVGVVALALDAETTLVASAMRPGITSVRDNEQVERAVGIMRNEGVRRLPVVDAAGRLVGLIAADDVLDALADEMSDLAMMVSHSMRREAVERKPIV